jgi:hypothetical protein
MKKDKLKKIYKDRKTSHYIHYLLMAVKKDADFESDDTPEWLIDELMSDMSTDIIAFLDEVGLKEQFKRMLEQWQ